MRGAVLYDYFYCPGGAEKVTLELAAGIPNTDICVGFRNPGAFDDVRSAGVRCQELGRPPRLNIAAWRTLSGLRSFSRRTGFVADYDWVVFSGFNTPVAVHHRPNNGNIYYCHTLPRFAYDLRDYYLERLPAWRRPAFDWLSRYLRGLYEDAIRRMDVLVANSENVRGRIQRYLGLDARVVYPPCDVTGYRWLGQSDYYLSTARLERYKRVDLAVRAFCRMPDKRLVVVSGGSELGRLQQLAAGARNITFVGWRSAWELQSLVGRAIATVYLAQDEDFGMSPVESMAAGKPVIAAAEGGLLETVLPDRTGLLVRKAPNEDDVITAVRSLSQERASGMRAACEARARLFTHERFIDGMREAIDESLSGRGTRGRVAAGRASPTQGR